MKEPRQDLSDILEYVEFRKIESESIPAEEVEQFSGMIQQAVEGMLDGLPEKMVDAISGCSDEQEIARLLRGVIEQAFADLDSQTKQPASNNWNFAEIQRAFSRGLRGESNVECSDSKYSFDWLAHQAKHSSENEYREAMRHKAIELLINGEQLPQAVRSWLVYILGSTDTLPHETKGAPSQARLIMARRYQLAAFIIKDEKTCTRSTVSSRLERAATSLNTTYETVRNDYYNSSEFDETLAFLRQCIKLQSM